MIAYTLIMPIKINKPIAYIMPVKKLKKISIYAIAVPKQTPTTGRYLTAFCLKWHGYCIKWVLRSPLHRSANAPKPPIGEVAKMTHHRSA